jgi:hypothetical protein
MLEPALQIPLITALGGLLVRRPSGWFWVDGMPELRVRDRLLADSAPAFEILPSGYPATAGGSPRCCAAGWIGIPEDWRNPGFWPGGRLHPTAVREIDLLIAERRRMTRGQRDAVYALLPTPRNGLAPRRGVAARRQTAPRKGSLCDGNRLRRGVCAPREGVAPREGSAPRKGVEILGHVGTWRVELGTSISLTVWAAAMGVIVGGAWDPEDEDWLLDRAELLV